ncbi:MAG: DUF167 domain-containing protein [Planctomycetia bacterium]
MVFRLKVRPGGRRNAVAGVRAGALKVSVTAAPEKGKANEAVLALLAEVLELPQRRLAIVRGETSPDKWVAVDGVDAPTLTARLTKILAKLDET